MVLLSAWTALGGIEVLAPLECRECRVDAVHQVQMERGITLSIRDQRANTSTIVALDEHGKPHMELAGTIVRFVRGLPEGGFVFQVDRDWVLVDSKLDETARFTIGAGHIVEFRPGHPDTFLLFQNEPRPSQWLIAQTDGTVVTSEPLAYARPRAHWSPDGRYACLADKTLEADGRVAGHVDHDAIGTKRATLRTVMDCRDDGTSVIQVAVDGATGWKYVAVSLKGELEWLPGPPDRTHHLPDGRNPNQTQRPAPVHPDAPLTQQWTGGFGLIELRGGPPLLTRVHEDRPDDSVVPLLTALPRLGESEEAAISRLEGISDESIQEVPASLAPAIRDTIDALQRMRRASEESKQRAEAQRQRWLNLLPK